MNKFYTLIFVFLAQLIQAQQTQTIKGIVTDIDTKQPLYGASVFISGETMIGTTADFDGAFKLENVPVGKVEVQCTYIGYEAFASGFVTLTSGKEMILNIDLQQSLHQTKEVVVKAHKEGAPNNDDFQISTKSFNIKETNRFAGSINDPGRVALNSPGVMSAQDNDNDVIIRGNSAIGVLWRLEGIDVPNVNHFSRPGSSGGGISALSSQMLGNTDFSTGAFPSEYGNAIAGAFDIKYRKGNTERHEFFVRAGLIGLNFGAEGPLNKSKKASYLFNYRYSTLGILNKIGLHVVSANTDNTFQDLAFNFNLPTKKKAYFTIFSLGGLSAEITNAKKDTAEWTKYLDRQQTDFVTNLGIIGGTWTQLINKKSYVKTVLALSHNDVSDDVDTLSKSIDYFNIRHSKFADTRLGLASNYNYKINAFLNFKGGFQLHEVFYSFDESKYVDSLNQTQQLISGKGATTVFQPYVQLKYRSMGKTTIIGGLHAVYLSLNNTYSIEPRFSINQQLGAKQSLTFAYGMHGQHLPMGTYFTQNETGNYVNKNLKMLRSQHLILSYVYFPSKTWKIKLEPYFQYLQNLPVSTKSGSSFMLLNNRSGYAEDSLSNNGTGMNYGVDIAIEKFYSKNWFMNFNASFFNSTYKTAEGKQYNTLYNNNFGLALMGGKEFTFKKNNSLELGLRMQFSGGFRYTPIDLHASAAAREAVAIESLAFTQKNTPYFRPDIRIAYKKNKPNYSWTLSLDLANFINHQNVLRQSYDPDTKQLVYNYQMGIIPILAYQIDFFGKKLLKKGE